MGSEPNCLVINKVMFAISTSPGPLHSSIVLFKIKKKKCFARLAKNDGEPVGFVVWSFVLNGGGAGRNSAAILALFNI